MKKLSLILISATALASAFTLANAGHHETAASPDGITHVVELFTSQGCSSCPPANRRVTKVSETPGVLALSYGVTYWDYLGWKDTFGDPKFTERQSDYQKALDGANLYTPQIVLNGSAHSPRYSVNDILSMPLPKDKAEVALKVKDGKFVLSSDQPAGGLIAFVTYMPGMQEVAVSRGENHGRNLKLTNVVTDIEKIEWDGRPVTLSKSPKAGHAYAALFHAPETAKITSVATYQAK